MALGGAISNLLSLGAKLLPAVNAALSFSSSPPDNQNHQIEAELVKLMGMVERIKDTLYDAEEREITDLAVKFWLKELKGVAYDGENVLSEYHYEVLRAQVEARDACAPDSRKRKLIQIPYHVFDQIQQIRSRFDEIANDWLALRLSEGDGSRRCNNRLQIAPDIHFVVESNIFGREMEKEKLLIKFNTAPSSSSSPLENQNHQIEAELKRLMRMLERIKVTLYEAEQREITDLAVKLWLKELKGVVYDGEDVLSEYHCEVLRAQGEARDAFPLDSRKWKLIQVPSGMLDQIQQIRSRFDEITNDRRALELAEADGPKRCDNELQIVSSSHFVAESNIFGRERDEEKLIELQIISSSHFVAESNIFGREWEKKKLIELLSTDSDGVSVVTIVGMGGIGKTTLAQLAYNDQRIRKKFDKFGWICVSEDFNVQRLTKESVESITGNDCSLTDLSVLQEKIRKEISGKRILLVLDDVWNEKKSLWNSFQAPFMSATFAKILVTTRNDPVARIMQTEPTFNLGSLSDEQCWQLFEHYAFGGVEQKKSPKLLEIGKQIMNKCGMLPLAVKSIASLLRQEVEEKSWRNILEYELWEYNGSNEIFAPLQISYARLPSCLKPCFLYCSMFPKGYKYNVAHLVKLWMYQGFIVSKGKKTVENIGFEYALELCRRSLFESADRYTGDIGTFKLHDIVHDLARLNSENECYSIEYSKLQNFPNVLYHLYIPPYVENTRSYIPIPSDKFTALRTLIVDFSTANFLGTFEMAPKLRALRIKSFYNKNCDFLPTVGNLKHLRYLFLDNLCFETLPECICSLYCLQNLTLYLNNKLEELPTKIGNLISLEELIIYNYYHLTVLPESLCQLKALRKLCIVMCPLKVLSSDIWRLTNLQTLKIKGTGLSYLPPSLSKFVGIQSLRVELECETIGWLKDFPDLGGALCLRNLGDISNLMDVQCANLVSMRNLKELLLHWGYNVYEGKEGNVFELFIERGQNIFLEDQSCVMASLRPHPNLRKLKIDGYRGNTFPEWIGSLCILKHLNISYCGSLQFIKAESLPSLKELKISQCRGLVSISGMQKLKSLVKVTIDNCGKLCSILGPSFELSMCAQEGSHGSSLLGLTSLADEWHPVELCNVEVSNCPRLWRWCLQHGINYKICPTSFYSITIIKIC